MKLEFNYKKKTRKILKHRDAKQCAKQTFINKEIIEEIKKKSETNENATQLSKIYRTQKNSANWEAQSNIGLPQNFRKLSNK